MSVLYYSYLLGSKAVELIDKTINLLVRGGDLALEHIKQHQNQDTGEGAPSVVASGQPIRLRSGHTGMGVLRSTRPSQPSSEK